MQMSEHSVLPITFAVDEDARFFPNFFNIDNNPFVLDFLGVDAATGLRTKAGTAHGMQLTSNSGHGSHMTCG
jgi:hypothetical protein